MVAPCFDTTCKNPAHLCLSCGEHGHYRETCEKFPPKCLHCELPGHFIDDCPQTETIRCFNCQKLGHTKTGCPLPQKKRKSDTTEESVGTKMLAEANKKTKIVHDGWVAKYGELEKKFGISEGINKELWSENKDLKNEKEDWKSEKKDFQGKIDRCKKDLLKREAWSETQATKIEDLERDNIALLLMNDDQKVEIESLKEEFRTLKASVRESLREAESRLDA